MGEWCSNCKAEHASYYPGYVTWMAEPGNYSSNAGGLRFTQDGEPVPPPGADKCWAGLHCGEKGQEELIGLCPAHYEEIIGGHASRAT